MRGAILDAHFRVVFGPGVLVLDHQGDGRTERVPLEHAGEDFDSVFFFALGGDAALAGAAAVKLALNGGSVEGDTWRAAVHDDAHAPAVRLSPGRDPEQHAECISHRCTIPHAGCSLAPYGPSQG